MLTLDFSGILGQTQPPAASEQRKNKETLLLHVQNGGDPYTLLLMALEYIGDITHDEAYKEQAQEAVRQLAGKEQPPASRIVTPSVLSSLSTWSAIAPYLLLKTAGTDDSDLEKHWQAAFAKYSQSKYGQQSNIAAAYKELKEFIAAAQWAGAQKTAKPPRTN